jgi:muconolactone delta-isomerase
VVGSVLSGRGGSLLDHERKRNTMTVYLVDRDLPGISMADLAAAQQRAIDWSGTYQSQGRNVRYIRSTFVPGESHCMCLFEAPTAEEVAALNEDAAIPYTRVTEALDLTPAD